MDLQLSRKSIPPLIAAVSDNSTHDDSSQTRRCKSVGLACDPCRKRKLKCDRIRPTCASCTRLGNDCRYELVRRKTGPRKGHLKHLYDKLAHMEALLQGSEQSTDHGNSDPVRVACKKNTTRPLPSSSEIALSEGNVKRDEKVKKVETRNIVTLPSSSSSHPVSTLMEDLLRLDLEDRPPPIEVTNELDEAYFKNVYTTVPIFHKPSFLASRDPILAKGLLKGLRYAMWALAAGTLEKYSSIQESMYRKARRCLQADEIHEAGNLEGKTLDLEHCQAWLMVTVYEFKNLDMSTAWISTGRAVRLAQLLSLQRLDAEPIVTAKQCLTPPRDATESEERRRTFWLVFWADRCASMGLGWPTAFPEADASFSFVAVHVGYILSTELPQIATNLPSFEEMFQGGQAINGSSLNDILQCKSCDYSPWAAIAVSFVLLGRIINHLHHMRESERTVETREKFWKKHSEIEDALRKFTMRLPHALCIPHGLSHPNIQFLHVNLRVCAICLNQTSISQVKNHPHFVEESHIRCIKAASDITTILRATCHQELATMNSFLCYGVYVAAMVFLQHLDKRGVDVEMVFSVKFLFVTLQWFAKGARNARLYLARLTFEIEKSAIPLNELLNERNDTSPILVASENTEELYDSFSTLIKKEENLERTEFYAEVMASGQDIRRAASGLPTSHLSQLSNLARQQPLTDDLSFSINSTELPVNPPQTLQVWHTPPISNLTYVHTTRTLSNTVFPWAGNIPSLDITPQPTIPSCEITPSTPPSQMLSKPQKFHDEEYDFGTAMSEFGYPYFDWESRSNMEWTPDWLSNFHREASDVEQNQQWTL